MRAKPEVSIATIKSRRWELIHESGRLRDAEVAVVCCDVCMACFLMWSKHTARQANYVNPVNLPFLGSMTRTQAAIREHKSCASPDGCWFAAGTSRRSLFCKLFSV